MAKNIDRQTFDSYWFAADTPLAKYSKFGHRPIRERVGSRQKILEALRDAVRDHHVHPAAVAGALARRGFQAASEFLAARLPVDGRTRMGNFGEVLASEHLRQRYGYDMPVFKLRFMEHANMPMRGEDVVAFRLRDGRVIVGLCVGEAKTSQAFRSAEVVDAHRRLGTAYHPHPVSLAMISNILHDAGNALGDQVDQVLETLGTRSFPRDNWIFIITGNRPEDPFSVLQKEEVVENLFCVNLYLEDLAALVQDLFDHPLGHEEPDGR